MLYRAASVFDITEQKKAQKKPPEKLKPATSKKDIITTESLLKKIQDSTKANFNTIKAEVIKGCGKGIDTIKIVNAVNAKNAEYFPTK